MFFTKLLLSIMGLFIIWGKVFMYFASQWTSTELYLLNNKFNINGRLDEFNIDYSFLKKINKRLNPLLDSIRKSTFFRIFKVNFDTECNFWTQNMICNFSTCSICSCGDEEIPIPWKHDSVKDTVDKNLNNDHFTQYVEKYNNSNNQWLVENEVDYKNGIFVNLLKNPETWTGYQGQKIWEAIYMENCFRNSIDEMCLEEKLFYRIVSGLHSNINLHLSQNFLNIEREDLKKKDHIEKINDEYNELDYYVNTTMAYERVVADETRVNNLFYLYSLVLTSIDKAEKTIKSFHIDSGNKEEDIELKKNITNFYNEYNSIEDINKVKDIYKKNEKLRKFLIYDKINEMKMRFRNISSIIDCVGCQKCKLHGKLQIYGLATMLKILFDKNEIVNLKRNEVIAYINLVSKIHRSIGYMIAMSESIESEDLSLKIKCGVSVGIYVLLVLIFCYYYIYIYEPKKRKIGKRRISEKDNSKSKELLTKTEFIIDSSKTLEKKKLD